MRLLPLLLILLLLAPASASAARAPRASLVECDQQERFATFRGEMRPLRRAPRMEMKFLLEVREPGEPWRRAKGVEGFGKWQAADLGRAGFIVDKRLEDLVPGLSLRALVRFRWRERGGRVAARARRLTRACRQPDDRPDLVADWVIASAGAGPDTLRYTVRVFNDGESDAPPFATALAIEGAQPVERSTTAPLAPGDEAVLEFEAPRCRPGSSVTITADVDGVVDERDEMDNTRTVPCDTAVGRAVAVP